MYTYRVDSIHDMVTITASLVVRAIGFRVTFNDETKCWIIELTGAY
jgi:hypothetical protein